MVEANKSVTLLEIEGERSDAFINSLRDSGIEADRKDPIAHLLRKRDVKGKTFLIELPFMFSSVEGVIKRVVKYGGTALVFAGDNPLYTEKFCRVNDVVYLGQANDVPPLVESIRRHLSPAA